MWLLVVWRPCCTVIQDPENPLLIVDVFVRESVPFATLSKKAVMLDMNGELVPVCDIETLIAMKLKAGRDKGLEDVKFLQKILNE